VDELSLQASELFRKHFGGSEPGLIVRAPGRVNLIGEHTDYNEGFVLPAAIDRETVIAVRRSGHNRVTVYAAGFEESGSFEVNNLEPGTVAGWLRYVQGVAGALAEAGHGLRGWDGVVVSSVPAGAGLSSSASFELAVARAFVALGDERWDPVAMAAICQEAERKWAGVNCGIMDQLASACGQPDMALLIDCRSLELTPVPVPGEWSLVIMDTATRRKLADSKYNIRRAECREACEVGGVASLRDLSLEALQSLRETMPHIPFRRARHVISENQRTLDAVSALGHGDAIAMGTLMAASHLSLQRDYEVSCPELDAMVEIAAGHPACIGARMTGAGFGGCAVAFVQRTRTEEFMASVSDSYAAACQITPSLYACRPSAGASVDTVFPRPAGP
jgi:galactokinase